MSAGESAVLAVVGTGTLIAVGAALLTWASRFRSRHLAHSQAQRVANRMSQEAHLWREPEVCPQSTAPVRVRPPTGPRRCVEWPSQGAGGHSTSPRHARAS